MTALLFFLTATNIVRAQRTDFDSEIHAAPPDYSLSENWAALPFRNDLADVLPKGESWVSDSVKQVDVFYVHPTIYQKGRLWNADLTDNKLNRKVDKWPVRLQASVFNASCRVYTPRYRQAVVDVFYNPSTDGQRALDLAYADVKKAFQYFLTHYSDSRPFIIAGHSQGTYHTVRLLQEMIDTTILRERLVAAYVVGLTVNEQMYENLHMCASPTETGCYLSWMSYREGYQPKWEYHKTTECVNPLTWSRDTAYISEFKSLGTVVFNPKRIRQKRTSARIVKHDGEILWVKTRAPWFQVMKNLHVADYGLFYMDIRANVKQRVDAYLKN